MIRLVQFEEGSQGRSPYRSLSLAGLLTRIVEDSDTEALIELHDQRTIFSFGARRQLRLVEYLRLRRDCEAGQSWGHLAHQAYDRTLDKFSRLPQDNGCRIDCRNYYRATLRLAAGRQLTPELASEHVLADCLQRMVSRHFELSCKEARRAGERTRYTWNINGGSVTVLMPQSLAATQRRQWLEDNIIDPDATRIGERERIQTLVDERLGSSMFVPLEDSQPPEATLSASDHPSFFAESIATEGLGATIAREKSDRLGEQRQTIRQLGAKRLRDLVIHIFDGVCTGSFNHRQTASEFGLSPSALSRFAGENWNHTLPDLWRNTAQALARSSPTFVEIARECRAGKRVLDLISAKGNP